MIASVDEYFVNKHHQMQEISKNSFRLRKINESLRQAKIGKHECYKITATQIRMHNNTVSIYVCQYQ